MSIPKDEIRKLIKDEQDKIVSIKAAKGVGITPCQVVCEQNIKAYQELIGEK